MVNLSNLRFDDRAPVYQQIAEYLKRQILLGTVQDGDPMPSRRELAAQTGLPVRCTLVREQLCPADPRPAGTNQRGTDPRPGGAVRHPGQGQPA